MGDHLIQGNGCSYRDEECDKHSYSVLYATFNTIQWGDSSAWNKQKLHLPIYLDHISNCQKWFSIYFPPPGKLGYFNVIKYSLCENLFLVGYLIKESYKITVSVYVSVCLPPYAVTDSWHWLGNFTGSDCCIQYSVKANPALPLLPIRKWEKINPGDLSFLL